MRTIKRYLSIQIPILIQFYISLFGGILFGITRMDGKSNRIFPPNLYPYAPQTQLYFRLSTHTHTRITNWKRSFERPGRWPMAANIMNLRNVCVGRRPVRLGVKVCETRTWVSFIMRTRVSLRFFTNSHTYCAVLTPEMLSP